MIRSIH